VFAGDADNVAWVIDLELDGQQRPYVVFSVQKDGRGLPRGQGGMDHRFDYGRWTARRGRCTRSPTPAGGCTRGDDYTGLAALDPKNPNVLYISTDADPVTGAPLVSRADGQRHRELYRGATADFGTTWTWTAITRTRTRTTCDQSCPSGTTRGRRSCGCAGHTRTITASGRQESSRASCHESIILRHAASNALRPGGRSGGLHRSGAEIGRATRPTPEDDVVSVGYGTQTRREITGAVSSYIPTEADGRIARIETMLQGIPGLEVIRKGAGSLCGFAASRACASAVGTTSRSS